MNQQNYRGPFVLITTLFFLWGFITVLVDSLVPRLREVFELSFFQAGLVQFAFFGAYFLLSIPASKILDRIGYRKGILLGLITMGVGCLLFYPAASYRVFGVFLLAYFTIAGGMTILQVAANPYVAVLGSEDQASSRLNLSQAFNSLGTAIAPAVGALLILSDNIKTSEEIAQLSDIAKEAYYNAEASAVQTPFLGLAIFIVILTTVFSLIKLPEMMSEASTGSYSDLFKNKKFMMGVAGIFCYVGAEVAIGTYLVNYFLSMDMATNIANSSFMSGLAQWFDADILTKDPKAIVGVFVTFYWSGAMIGRFVGSYLTSRMQPTRVLSIFASCAIGMILLSVVTSGFVSMWSILAVGLFNSIMFPTIFTIALDGLGDLKPKASGLLCTAIVGGALIPPFFGKMVDLLSFGAAFVIITSLYGFIFYFGYRSSKATA